MLSLTDLTNSIKALFTSSEKPIWKKILYGILLGLPWIILAVVAYVFIRKEDPVLRSVINHSKDIVTERIKVTEKDDKLLAEKQKELQTEAERLKQEVTGNTEEIDNALKDIDSITSFDELDAIRKKLRSTR